MFPWSPEFRWDVGHLLFFGGLYSVLVAMLTTVALSLRRARTGLEQGHAAGLGWRDDFDQLPAEARACRHQICGAAPGRVCQNGFDCRSCSNHAELLKREGAAGERSGGTVAGLSLDTRALYHRGHTWVRPESDGTVTIGLDPLGQKLVGHPERLGFPAPGTQVVTNGPLCSLRASGCGVRILSPIDGEVLEVHRAGERSTLRLRPKDPLDTRHLLTSAEVGPWLLRELERLQLCLSAAGSGPALADGGQLVPDLGRAVPHESYRVALEEMFLDPR